MGGSAASTLQHRKQKKDTRVNRIHLAPVSLQLSGQTISVLATKWKKMALERHEASACVDEH